MASDITLASGLTGEALTLYRTGAGGGDDNELRRRDRLVASGIAGGISGVTLSDKIQIDRVFRASAHAHSESEHYGQLTPSGVVSGRGIANVQTYMDQFYVNVVTGSGGY